MKIVVRLSAVTLATAGFAGLLAFGAFAEECKTFGATGSGISKDVAALMARQGAINVAEARGYTVKGEGRLAKCVSGGIFGTECTAYQRACK